MYGVVEISGHQYKVQPGDLIDVEKLASEEGKTVDLESVLLIGGDETIIGLPTVKGAKIKAKVVRQARSRKIIVFKRKPRSGRRCKNGHRQHYTALLITEISDGKGNTQKIDTNSVNAKKYLK